MNNFRVIKHNDEYRVHSCVLDVDGTVLDVSQTALDFVAFSFEDLQLMVEAIYDDVVLNSGSVIDYDEQFDESQFEFDRFTPVDEAFR